ncbi:MAG: integration host factor subunit alpha [Alphaproteobacteria bacterium]|nr:integration host factor subunit alpha [Alphaproteobacteria bacterium]
MKEKAKTLTRADLAENIMEVFDVTKFEALDFIDDVLEEIGAALAEGESVKISRFGSFMVRDKKERIGRNPRTLEKAIISPRRSISFKPSTIFKNAISGDE